MRRKFALLLVVLGLFIAAGITIKILGSRSPRQGELRVDSQPAASIFLDDKNIGRTPFRDKVNSGEYTLKLVPESAVSQLAGWEGRVSVGANLLTYVNSNLAESELGSAIDVLWLEKITSKKSDLSVVTNPDGASVILNDETKGMTPISIADLSPGDYTVTITSPGFLTRTLKIKLTSGFKVIANIKLALSGGAPPEATASSTIEEETTPTPSGTPGAKPTPTKAATSEPVKPYVLIKETPTGFLRVRLEPSTSATEVARIKPGEKYSLVDEQSGWYQIKYETTKTGWVSGQYADKVE